MDHRQHDDHWQGRVIYRDLELCRRESLHDASQKNLSNVINSQNLLQSKTVPYDCGQLSLDDERLLEFSMGLVRQVRQVQNFHLWSTRLKRNSFGCS